MQKDLKQNKKHPEDKNVVAWKKLTYVICNHKRYPHWKNIVPLMIFMLKSANYGYFI